MTELRTSFEPTARIGPTVVARRLMLVVVAFFIGAIVTTLIGPGTSDSLIGELRSSLHRLLNPDLEANLTTWFSTALLLAGATLAGIVAKVKHDTADPLRYHWIGLATILLIMSADEAAQIHEMLIRPTQKMLGVTTAAGWVWVLPALVVVAVLVLASLRMVRAQPPDVRRLLQLSFFVFLIGAVGIETVGSLLYGDTRPAGYELAAAVEELFEMSGVVIFITAMLTVLVATRIRIHFEDTRARPTGLPTDGPEKMRVPAPVDRYPS